MEIDLEAVKAVGAKHYPGLADVYAEAAAFAVDSQVDVPGEELIGNAHGALATYLDTLRAYLSLCEQHLDACGESLVRMVDELDWTDEQNAYNFERPTDGLDLPPDMT